MDAINLKVVTPHLNEQLAFLVTQEYRQYWKQNSHKVLALLTVFILVSITHFLPETEILLLYKGVGTFMSFIIFPFTLYFVFLWTNTIYKRKRWMTSYIKKATEENKSFSLSFDEDKLYFLTEQFKTELNWEYFTYYTENKNSIFLIPKQNIYESLFYSKEELGNEIYNNMKKIASSKLVLFE